MLIEEFIQDVAREAGGIVKKHYQTDFRKRSKDGGGDVVTEIDEAVENYIVGRIKSQYPDDAILSEECGAIEGGSRVWIIDPIDGTRNFVKGIPFFCVSIAAVTDGQIEVGAIYDPVHDEMFFAKRGSGATVNGDAIRVAEESTIDDALISVSWVKRKVDRRRFVSYVEQISKDTSYFRRFGSAALVLAYVACGRLHGYMQGGLNPWDVAAGILIIEEAGGVVTDFEGKPIDLSDKDIAIVTGNPDIHSILVKDVIESNL